MTGTLKPYPEYKESGLPWAPIIPTHWKLVPNRALMRKRKLLVGVRHVDYPLLSLTKEGVIVRDISTGKGKFSADMGTSQEVCQGNLVFCLFDVPETPRTVGLSRHDGMITGAYTVFECVRPNIGPFFEKFYIAMDDRKLLGPIYSGLRNTIPPSRFLGIKTPVPPEEEQSAIVRYLDHMDRLIWKYLRDKRRLIKLLEEQKQAIIHRAVTRGLDPNVKLKPSGVVWLGDVPEHWEVLRSKYIFQEVDERSATGEEKHFSMSQKLGLVPSSHIEERRLVSESYVGGKICERDDLVLNRLKAHLGVFALAPERGLVSADYTVFRQVRHICPRYFELAYRTPACRVELRRRAKGIVQGFWRLYTDDFYNIRMPLPPIHEEERIIAQLKLGIAGLNIAITRTEREISLIREYRTRLIADVVTGKVDVREAAKNLPEEIEDPETSEEAEIDDEGLADDETGDDDGDFFEDAEQ